KEKCLFQRSYTKSYTFLDFDTPCDPTVVNLADISSDGHTLEMVNSSGDGRRIFVEVHRDANRNPDLLRIRRTGGGHNEIEEFSLTDAADPNYIGGGNLNTLIVRGTSGDDSIY